MSAAPRDKSASFASNASKNSIRKKLCQNAIVTKEHGELSARLRGLLAKYQEVELLLKIGEYAKGSDAATDEAIAKIDKVNAFLRQGLAERPDFSTTLAKLKEAVA